MAVNLKKVREVLELMELVSTLATRQAITYPERDEILKQLQPHARELLTEQLGEMIPKPEEKPEEPKTE